MKRLVAVVALALVAACGSDRRTVVLCPGVDVDVGHEQTCPEAWHPPMRSLEANEIRKLPHGGGYERRITPEGDTVYDFETWTRDGTIDRLTVPQGEGYEMTLVFYWRGEPAFCSGRCEVFVPGVRKVETLIGVQAATLLGADLGIEIRPRFETREPRRST